MKEDEKKIQEPYKPEDTPKPPQVMDPNKRDQQEPNSGKKKTGTEDQTGKNIKSPQLGDETEITDETTI